MKKVVMIAALSAAVAAQTVQANEIGGVGVGINYGLIEGASLEINYPINEYFQVRGNFSAGAGISETQTEDGIVYNAEADGGVHRLAINYHPFGGNFFLSAGYAVNNFALDVTGEDSGAGSVTVGNQTYQTNDLMMKGNVAWDDAPVVSLGWGHSPAKGFGAFFEAGVMFTGSPEVNLRATGTVAGNDINDASGFTQALQDEEQKLKEDVTDADMLPVLQVGITYRF